MGDGDDAVAEAEREQHLGGRRDEATRSARRERWHVWTTRRSSERLADLDGWERDGDAIAQGVRQRRLQGSVEFVNRLTPVAEEMNHHPDLAISWNKVTVTITTHSEGGLTENDFELAREDRRVA